MNKNRLFIKNMVCPRCILSVEQLLNELNMPYEQVLLGEVVLKNSPDAKEQQALEQALKKVGFELIETRLNKIIEDIRLTIMEYLSGNGREQKINLSAYITEKIPYDYSYLSDLFSSTEGTSIEQFFILQRIKKVKELIVYDQLSLTEIAHQMGFSSVHHLSAQFRKHTGLTPSHFKKLRAGKGRTPGPI